MQNTVIYISDENRSFPSEELIELFEAAGKKLVFLPDVLAALNPDQFLYMFPGQEFPDSAEELSRRLVEKIGFSECPGFLYKKSGNVCFHSLAGLTGEQVFDEIRDFTAPRLEKRCAREASRKRREIKREIREPSFFDLSFSEEAQEEDAQEEAREQAREQDDVALDPRVEAILEAWREIERKFGITVEDLEVFLGYKVKLSRLRIATSGRMFLADFGNQEVKMDNLTKALYFFFLRHRDGARLKELQEHEDEILHIYSGITGRDDVEGIRSSVHNLLDPFGNALNVSLSRIKKAFRDVVGDRIACFYFVLGRSGEVRKVNLDRDLVIWEH